MQNQNQPSVTGAGTSPRGYIFNFPDHGAFSPDGKVADYMPQAEIDAHNRQLAQAEIEAMKQTGRATLYLFHDMGAFPREWHVGTWASKPAERLPICFSKRSWHNMAGKDGRMDVWFNFDGSRWHGVNIGDNDIVRCKRTKGKS